MLLPIELFHVCVRIHIDISDIRRDRPAAGADEQGRAGRESFRVAVGYVVVMVVVVTFLRGSPARPPRAPAWRLALGTGSARLAGSASNVARGRRV